MIFNKKVPQALMCARSFFSAHMHFKTLFILIFSSTTFSPLLAAESTPDASLERIEVKGQINNGLLESNIRLADASSPDLRAQLSQIPGISVNGNGLVSGVVQYRGLFGDRLLVKVDGTRIAGAGPNAMDSPLSHAMGNRQEVILYQGIAPVAIGYETLAGAIEIKDAAPTFANSSQWETEGQVSTAYFHNNDAKHLGARVDAATQQSYVSIQGQYQDADNYQSGNDIVVPSTFYSRSGAKLAAGYHTDKTKLDAMVGVWNTNESGTPALAMDIQFIDALWYQLKLSQQITAQWEAKLKLFGNQNEHVMNNFELRTPPMPAMQRINTVDSKAFGLDASAIKTNNNDSLELGFNIYQQSNNSRITNPNNAMFFIQNFNNIRRRVSSIYGQYDFIIDGFELVNWQLGARTTNIDYDAEEVASNMAMMNPNVATLVSRFNNAERSVDFGLYDLVLKASRPLSEHTRATVSVGQKERAPSYSELYSWFPLGVSAGLADGRNYIGDLSLNKESAAQVDFGLQYQKAGLSVMANIFYQSIDDYIVGVPTNDMPANMLANMMGAQAPLQWNNREARLYGSDLYLAKSFNSNWQASLSAQWVKGDLKDTPSGDQLALYRIAPFSGDASIKWTRNEVDVALMLNLAAKQNDVSGLQNEMPTAGYGVWNINANYQYSSALQFSLIVENLFDKAYAKHLGGINRINDEQLSPGEKVPESGRNIGVYINYAF